MLHWAFVTPRQPGAAGTACPDSAARIPPVPWHRWRPWWRECGLLLAPELGFSARVTPVPVAALSPQHQEQHSEGRSAPSSEPHLIFVYEDRQILEDAAALISYYVKRQPAIQKEDQGTIHQLVHQFVPSLFFSQQLDLGASEDSADEGRASPQGQAADPGGDRKKPAPGPQSSPPESSQTLP